MTTLFRDVSGQPVCGPQGSVVCIGAFDGLHRGHQALIEHTRQRARESDRVGSVTGDRRQRTLRIPGRGR